MLQENPLRQGVYMQTRVSTRGFDEAVFSTTNISDKVVQKCETTPIKFALFSINHFRIEWGAGGLTKVQALSEPPGTEPMIPLL